MNSSDGARLIVRLWKEEKENNLSEDTNSRYNNLCYLKQLVPRKASVCNGQAMVGV